MSSGDIGHFNENGLLFVDGRDDDMIVSGGENVFPQEVENLLESGTKSPTPRWSAWTMWSSENGCAPSSFPSPAPHRTDGDQEYVKANLARHKVPRDVVFIDELPRNATGKLLRRVLVEMDVDS